MLILLKYKIQHYSIKLLDSVTFLSVIMFFGIVSILANLIPNFQNLIAGHLYLSVLIGLLTIILLRLMHVLGILKRKENQYMSHRHVVEPHVVAENTLVYVRFAQLRDIGDIHEIAENWFSPEIHIGSHRMSKWLRYDKEIFRVAELMSSNKKKIILFGYYIVLPLSEIIYNLIRDERIKEKDITVHDICHFSDNKTSVLYIVDIVKTPNTGKFSGWGLTADLVRFIGKCFDQNENIKKVGAWALLRDGEDAAKKIGMRRVKVYRDGSAFFEMSADRFRYLRAKEGTIIARYSKSHSWNRMSLITRDPMLFT